MLHILTLYLYVYLDTGLKKKQTNTFSKGVTGCVHVFVYVWYLEIIFVSIE